MNEANHIIVKGFENGSAEKKIPFIKLIRDYTGWGLAYTKTLVDMIASSQERIFDAGDLLDGYSLYEFYLALRNAGAIIEVIENGEEYMGGRVLILERVGEKKIQTIKVVRSYTGWSLLDAKRLVDDVCLGRKRSFLKLDIAFGTAREFYEELVAVDCDCTVLVDGDDDADDELPPLSVMELAVKLALKGYDHKSARSLADALNGIEDASGSLRAAALIMESVA